MKLRQFQSCLKDKQLDFTILVHPDPNIIYFTQFKPSSAYLIITPKKADLYLSKLDHAPQAKQITCRRLGKNWHYWCEKKKKVKRIGINKETLTLARHEELKKKFPKAKFVDISPELNRLRAEKTPAEIKKIARACQITDNALQALARELPKKELKTEQDTAFFVEKKIREQGAELAFPTIIAMGKNAAIPHHVTSNQKLSRGFLLIDCGACYQNYCSDISRVLFLGRPTRKEQEFYQLLLKAQEETIKKINEKIKFSELDKTARNILGKYASHFIHALGHGVGVEIHEMPNSKDEAAKIEKNQVFTIEPGIYFPGKFGLRIEDTILFDGKTKILTRFPKELVNVEY